MEFEFFAIDCCRRLIISFFEVGCWLALLLFGFFICFDWLMTHRSQSHCANSGDGLSFVFPLFTTANAGCSCPDCCP